MYSVAPSQDWVDEATLRIAFASAWSTYHLVYPSSSSQKFSKPVGVPLYPSDIIILSFTIMAPTCLLLQYDNLPHSWAILKYALSYFSCLLAFINPKKL